MVETRRQMWQMGKYLWMSLAFTAAYVPIAQARHLLLVPLWGAWGVLALGVASGALRSACAYRSGGAISGALSWAFNLFDIGLISLAVGLTKGVVSDLWLLYFVIMVSETMYAPPRQVRLISFVIALAYLASTLPQQLTAPASDAFAYGTTMLARLFFLIVIGAYGRRISENATRRSRELQTLHEQVVTGEERARIAREVHDGLGHALVSVILRLELCHRLLTKNPTEAEAILREEVPALRNAWNESRDLAFHLRPWETDADTGETLPDRLRRHIGRFAERTGLSVSFTTEGDDWRLRPAAAFGLLRIVQEALTNAARHAQAGRIEVALITTDRSRLTCSICDDGKGFAPGAQAEGFGMQAMRERAQSLDGSLTIESAPGCGVKIQVALPR